MWWGVGGLEVEVWGCVNRPENPVWFSCGWGLVFLGVVGRGFGGVSGVWGAGFRG